MTRRKGSIPAILACSICALALAPGGAGAVAGASRTARTPTKARAARLRAVGVQARTIDLVESARLAFLSEDGAAIVEHGQAAGTYNAPVTASFTIHPKSVTASVTVYPHGGSITGVAKANYVVQNSVGYFGGTFEITRGTGSFAHASGKDLGISGTINRYTFAVTVKAHGEVRL